MRCAQIFSELRETAAHVEERHFWVRSGGDLIRIRTNDVQWIEAQASYVRLHLAERSYLVRNAIGILAEQLAEEGFVRVHKSAVVNRRKVLRITSQAGSPRLVLEGGAEVQVGRKYRTAAEHIVEAGAPGDA